MASRKVANSRGVSVLASAPGPVLASPLTKQVAGSGCHRERRRTSFDPSQPNSIENLQVVFKVVERCNINCTYCYYFNMGDTTAMSRPAVATTATTQALAEWLAEGCRELRIPNVKIAFHGGEPMLVKPRHFDDLCRIFRRHVAPVAELSFGIQTNGTILSDAWLSIFREHAVRVGVSIDGDRAAHDRYRLDHRGRSTFDRTEAILKRLAVWADGDPRLLPATISVLDRHNDYRHIYEYLRGLDVRWMNFLLPDRNADDLSLGANGSAGYGKSMLEIFEAWLTEDDPSVYIKFCQKALAFFQIFAPVETADGSVVPTFPPTRRKKTYQIIVARSDGTLAVDDLYIPALSWYEKTPVYSVREHSLREFLADEIFHEIEAEEAALPSGCTSCRWRKICGGGDLEN